MDLGCEDPYSIYILAIRFGNTRKSASMTEMKIKELCHSK